MSTRIYRACDRCESEGIDSPGEPRGPFLGKTVDLCGPCFDDLAKDLVALLDDRGVPVDGKTRRGPYRARKAPAAAEHAAGVPMDPGVVACLLCDHVGTVGGMGGHLRRVHHTTVADTYGPVCPVCGKTAGGTHIGRSHPEVGHGMAGAMEWARHNGDPHGVYAGRVLALAS